jgi:hypothetical protein
MRPRLRRLLSELRRSAAPAADTAPTEPPQAGPAQAGTAPTEPPQAGPAQAGTAQMEPPQAGPAQVQASFARDDPEPDSREAVRRLEDARRRLKQAVPPPED